MTTIHRRRLLAAAGFLPLVQGAWAQGPAFPSRPVRLTVGFATGGGTDVAARLFAQKLTTALGQPVVVENRTGAAGSIAAGEVLKAEPDGHRLLMLASTTFIHAALSTRVSYQIERDFTPISMAAYSPLVLVAGPSVTARNVPELIAFARAHPGKLSFGSDGIGGTSHLAGELFNLLGKVRTTHIPFKGNSDAAIAIAGGQVDIGYPSLASAHALLQAGKYRALAVTSLRRSELMPQLATLDELGLKGLDLAAWFGFVGPAGMNEAVVEKLRAAIAAVAAAPDMKEALNKQVLEVMLSTPQELTAYFRQQNEIITRLGREADIRLE